MFLPQLSQPFSFLLYSVTKSEYLNHFRISSGVSVNVLQIGPGKHVEKDGFCSKE